jgi:hypothetical protein
VIDTVPADAGQAAATQTGILEAATVQATTVHAAAVLAAAAQTSTARATAQARARARARMTRGEATVSALQVLAGAQWPTVTDRAAKPPPVPGFIFSSFSPLVIEVAERCLRQVFGEPPAAGPPRSERIGILLCSAGGDRATARALAAAVGSGTRVAPLLFFQSNPNAVLGHVAARWNLAGPVVSLRAGSAADTATAAPGETPRRLCELSLAEALTAAAVMIGDGDADEALVLAVEQGADPHPAGDCAVALYVAGDG